MFNKKLFRTEILVDWKTPWNVILQTEIHIMMKISYTRISRKIFHFLLISSRYVKVFVFGNNWSDKISKGYLFVKADFDFRLLETDNSIVIKSYTFRKMGGINIFKITPDSSEQQFFSANSSEYLWNVGFLIYISLILCCHI